MLDQHLNPLFLVILLLLAVCSLCDSVYSFGGSIVFAAIIRAPTNQSSTLTTLFQ